MKRKHVTERNWTHGDLIGSCGGTLTRFVVGGFRSGVKSDLLLAPLRASAPPLVRARRASLKCRAKVIPPPRRFRAVHGEMRR